MRSPRPEGGGWVSRLAQAVGDGGAVDWSEARRRLGRLPDGDMVARLHLVADTSEGQGPAGTTLTAAARLPGEEASRVALGFRLLLAGALAQVTWAVVAFTTAGAPAGAVPPVLPLATAVVFAGAAAVLGFGGRFDRRARYLAGFFAGIASAASQPFLVPQAGPAAVAAAGSVLAIPLFECFLPFFLWSFVRAFPRIAPFSPASRLAHAFVPLSAVAGGVFFTLNALYRSGLWQGGSEAAALFLRSVRGPYWPILFLLALPAPAVAFLRARRARNEERRRVGVFLGGLALGVLPLLTLVLAETLLPPFGAWMAEPGHRTAGSVVVYGFLLVVPLVTSYSVTAHRILDMRLVLRNATRFALARWTLAAASVLPLAALAGLAWVHRSRSLAELAAHPAAVVALVAAAVALLLLALRQPLLHRLEAWLLGRPVQHSGVLAAFSIAAAGCRDRDELARHAVEHARRLTGSTGAALWTRNRETRVFEPLTGPGRSLPEDSLVSHLADEIREPLAVEPWSEDSLFPLLPEEDRQWVTDHEVALVVPLAAPEGDPPALLTLGAPRSGLAATAAEQRALAALAATAALVWGHRGAASAGETNGRQPRAVDQPAGECAACGRVVPRPGGECTCGGTLVPAAIPVLLAGKFRLQRVLGEGGMGRVYLAVDETLDRRVALKTLPRMASDPLLRLRREARAMAALDHPRLATLYGVETWRGVLVLVVEYLAGGTLAARLYGGGDPAPLPASEVLELGIKLLDGLGAMHAAGYLHRDIKPSNVGFTAAGEPKLLDFGLARLIEEAGLPMEDAAGMAATDGVPPGEAGVAGPRAALTRTGHAVGTPLYMSPETLAGAPPAVAQDLWSLHVLLWETLAGRHPAAHARTPKELRHLWDRRTPDLAAARPDCPEILIAVVQRGLDPNLHRRPTTAAVALNALQTALRNLNEEPRAA